MSSLSTLPKGDSAWLLRKAIERIMQQISVLETNIGSSTTGNSNDTEIIFNDAGTLRGDKDFAWNRTSNILTIDGSATITGDLTVDTSTLKVDSTNDRVGIGTATPGSRLDVRFSTNPVIDNAVPTNALRVFTSVAQAVDVGGQIGLGGLYDATNFAAFANISGKKENSTSGNTAGYLVIGTCNSLGTTAERYRIDSTGISTWSVAGTTAMTLNSTGLGVGTTDTTNGRLNIRAGTAATGNSAFFSNNDGTYNPYLQIQHSSSGIKLYTNSSFGGDAGNLTIGCGGATNALIVNGSGNVGIGVTPSAWAGGSPKAIDVGSYSSYAQWNNATGVVNNAYLNSSSAWIYKNNAAASAYYQIGGAHTWQTAASGTAGGTATFTTAMTLDASGNLLVGTASPLSGNAAKLHLSTDSGTTRWAVGPYSTATNFIISAVGGSGVYLNGTAATSWTSASDERLKDIIEPISNAVSKVGSLRAVIGKFKFDELNTRKPFLIAQDVQSVLPEAVDASNPDKLGVAYTDVIPLLVAAIKELTARVQTLEAR